MNFSNDVSIHQRHLRFLATEVYQSLMNINPEFMWEFFNKNPVQYNLRNGNIFISHLPDPAVMELTSWLSVEAFSGIVFPVMQNKFII